MIERIYETLVDPSTGSLSRTIVTLADIAQAIEWCVAHRGTKLSSRNPANFIKDVIRGSGASKMWPDRLKTLRIGGKQVTGDGNGFEFVPYALGQKEPFPNRFGYHSGVQQHRLQSVSMPLATKSLGRSDETYMIQIAVKLGIVETHFALYSPINVVELNHLQIGIKLRRTEVDSLYAAKYQCVGGDVRDMVITVEAKKRGQRILEEQVVQQVRAAFKLTSADLVVPIAMTATRAGIYIAEFRGIKREELISFDMLDLATEVLYELVPSVPGI